MHVVLLGYRREAVEELHRLGHRITLLYLESNRLVHRAHPGQIAHRAFIPAYDVPEAAWSALLHLGVADEVDTVVPCHELAVVTAALLNELLGRPGRIGVATAMAGRDKAQQKSLWARHGVPTSRFVTFTNTPDSLDEVHAGLGDLPAPYIVKPPALGGSRLVRECPTAADVMNLLSGNAELRHCLVEERQSGPEWELDGVVIDGQVSNLLVARYLSPMIETKQGAAPGAVAYPAAMHPDLYGTAYEFAQSAVEALGGRWGVFHLEVFGRPGRFVAGELAWRPPGDFCPLLMKHIVGMDTWASHVRVLIGADLKPLTPVTGRAIGRVGLPLRPGARNTIAAEDIAAMPGVIHFEVLVPPGQVMREVTTSTMAVAWVLVEAADVADCERMLHDAVRRTDDLHDRAHSGP